MVNPEKDKALRVTTEPVVRTSMLVENIKALAYIAIPVVLLLFVFIRGPIVS